MLLGAPKICLACLARVLGVSIEGCRGSGAMTADPKSGAKALGL